MMDVPRTGAKPRLRRAVIVAAGGLVLAAITLGIRWYTNRAPTVSRTELWVGIVERGPLTFDVRGQGTLVPTDFRWASSPIAARVDKVLVQPGAEVAADAVLIELSNPDAELAALEADRDVAQAEATLAQLVAQLDGTRLAQESAVAGLQGEEVMATRRKEIDTKMAEKGVISDLESAESQAKAAQLATRREFEQRRLLALKRGNSAQLDAQKSQVERLRALSEFRRKQLEALRVRAGQAGVVQQVAVEAGQSVAAGAPLAKVIDPTKLQARLRIPETATTDVTLGLAATVDTRNGVVKGEVVRIDPAAVNGSVIVDVKLVGELPRSARADQNVDGTIELGTTKDVLHVPRPAIGEAHSAAAVFVLRGDEATRVSIKFGRAAMKDIEVVSGLREGDQIVLSDMAKWDGVNRLRVE
jgi:RND family efflux transporter MFP subunit